MSKNYSLKISTNRSFGIVFFFVFITIALWNFEGNFSNTRLSLLGISLLFLVLGFLNSKILTPLNILWHKFGVLLGNIISPLVMAFVFFLIVFPIGLIMKMLGKDLLNIKFNKKIKSYWIKKNTKSSMKQQF